MAEGQVNNRVCLPYMADKTSSCNFRDTLTQGKSNILPTVQIKLLQEKLLGTSIVHTEKSHSCSLYYTFCRAGQNFVGQVEIKVYQRYLASAFKHIMLSPAYVIQTPIMIEIWLLVLGQSYQSYIIWQCSQDPNLPS